MARLKSSAGTAPGQAFFRRLQGFDSAYIRVSARIRIFETFLALGSAPPHLAELLSLVDGLRAGEARRSAASFALTPPLVRAEGDEKGGGVSVAFEAKPPTAWRRAVESPEGDPAREPWPPLKRSELCERAF